MRNGGLNQYWPSTRHADTGALPLRFGSLRVPLPGGVRAQHGVDGSRELPRRGDPGDGPPESRLQLDVVGRQPARRARAGRGRPPRGRARRAASDSRRREWSRAGRPAHPTVSSAAPSPHNSPGAPPSESGRSAGLPPRSAAPDVGRCRDVPSKCGRDRAATWAICRSARDEPAYSRMSRRCVRTSARCSTLKCGHASVRTHCRPPA